MRSNEILSTRTQRSRGLRLVTCALCATTVSLLTFAQEEEKNDDDDVYTLSPFEISTTENEGYRANSTLAGSRINTNLKDVAAAISIVTEDFIDDVGAVDLNDILVYMANTESTKNYTNAGEKGNSDNVANNPQRQNRVRGLGAADLTRDYFRSIGGDLGIDSYNIERVTINRGPNSILYGLGNPNGVINYRTKSAYLGNNAYEVSFRIGSNEDVRGSFDFNRVLVEDKLAVRLLGMKSDRGYQQQPSYFKDNRINLSLIYKPFENTTLKVNVEKIKQDQNNPNTITPLDHVTEWKNQGRPVWDPTTDDYWNSPDYVSRVQSDTQVAIFNYDGSADHFFMGGAGSSFFSSVYQQNNTGADLFTEIAFSDSSIAPMHDMNLNPNHYDQELDSIIITWDQKILEGLYLNIGYITETKTYESYYFTRGFEIYVDNNIRLPDGSTNPHFGETYTPQRSLDNKSVGEDGNEMIRATLTYELDLEGRFHNSWLKWLGRHNFTALVERQETDYANNVYNEIREDIPDYLDASNRDGESWQTTRIRYLGGTADTQATIAPVFPNLIPDGVSYSYYNADTGTWETDTYDSMYALKRRDLGTETVKSSALIWQSYWLDGRIVGTAGWRKDEDVATQGTYNTVGSNGLITPGNDTTEGSPVDGTTTTFGVVAHPLSWLSVHYNESENFQPAASDVNMYGETVAPPSGTGKDWGFSLQLLEGKLNIRTNWYEVQQTNSRMGWGDAMQLGQWELLLMDEQVMPETAAAYGVDYQRISPLATGDGRIVTTSDVVAKGVEIELTYNPTKNLRIMANISKQEAVSSNIGKSVARFLAEALPYWENLGGGEVWDGPIEYSIWGVEGNPKAFFDFYPSGRTLTYNAAEGRSNPQLREWHINMITNYSFTDGRMKGWNMGGALRWQSEAAIGFATIKEDGLIVGLDLDNPYTDDAKLDLDLWVGFDKMILKDKVKMNIQFNVQNLTRSEGFQAINANSDGTPSGFRIEFGPTWTLQSTFSW